jgi:hypothetical protein
MSFPFYIQQAVDLGLLQAEDGKIVGCDKDSIETVMGAARLVEKIQPTTTAQLDDTADQEAIILCRVLSSPSGLARELWSQLRIAFGIGHGQSIPQNLWSTNVFRTIGDEIDRTFMGERNASVISYQSLINQYEQLTIRPLPIIEFNEAVSRLADPDTMRSYGDAKSEWSVALDLLRQSRVRALYKETLHVAEQVGRTDSKLEKNIEFLQSRAMECIGMLRGSIGNQGNAVDVVNSLYSEDGRVGLFDRISNAQAQERPISTGIAAIDIDMEGGIRPTAGGGRLFTLAARTGVGKTILGVQVAANAAVDGVTVGFISAELDFASIEARLWSAISHRVSGLTRGNVKAVTVGQIESPNAVDKVEVPATLADCSETIQNSGGKLLIEAPWGADVDAVINSMRSMKAQNPELRCVVLDHFHCLARHKGSSANEAAMMEDRAYRLMTAAKELDIDLIVLAQMNRVGLDAVNRNEAPQLNEIRGTDALSHVSHAVWIIRRKKSEDGQPVNRELEFWHAKTRGRQAYWDPKSESVVAIRNFQEKAIIEMDYAYSSVKWDGTMESIRASNASF